MARLDGLVSLITGAASGIGKTTAEEFAKEGSKVILSDINDEKGYKLAKEIGPNASYINLDVCDEKAWEKTKIYIEENFGRLDVLFNNAGIIGVGVDGFGPQDPEHTSLKDWDKINQINSDSVFLGCRFAIEMMKKNGGSIINMSSRSGIVGVPGACAYASSKAAIRNHTKSVALYCAQEGYPIRCNSVHPAAILTPIWKKMLGNDENNIKEKIKEMSEKIPIGRMGEPIDVAYGVIYLASKESNYITGIELTIDGGILAGSSASPKTKD